MVNEIKQLLKYSELEEATQNLIVNAIQVLEQRIETLNERIELYKKEIALLKSNQTFDKGEYYIEYEQERLQRTGDGGDDEGFNEWNKNS